MTTHVRLDPGSPTPRELVIAEVNDPLVRLAAAYETILANDRPPSPDWMPWLVAEWGLGELVPYLPNPYLLCDVGPSWQRIRGTPAAIATGIGWIGYAAILEWALARRRRWHLWQMALDRLPDAERLDLDRIDGIASLSDDATSHFWRGWRGWDVRPMETGMRRWGGSMWGAASGVRITSGGALWSFGRPHEVDLTLTEAQLIALGAWIPSAGSSDAWVDMHHPWTSAEYPWTVEGRQSRRTAIAADLAARRWHLIPRAADGEPIGACPAIVHAVAAVSAGPYVVGDVAWSPSSSPAAIVVRARTPFEAAPGAVIASLDLVADVPLVAGVEPGRRWLSAEEIDLDSAACITAVSGLAVTMAATVRELVTCIMRID
jgi:hypothetical protein